MAEHAPKHFAPTPTNPYEQYAETARTVVEDHASKLADSYVDAASINQETLHSLHSDAMQEHLNDVRQHTSIAQNQIKLLQAKLNSGVLTGSKKKQVLEELANWQGKLDSTDEADNFRTIAYTQALHETSQRFGDAYDFWGYNEEPAKATEKVAAAKKTEEPKAEETKADIGEVKTTAAEQNAAAKTQAEEAEDAKEPIAELEPAADDAREQGDNTAEHLKGFHFDIGRAEDPVHGEDLIISNLQTGTFAVVDGMGGEGGGDVAAKLFGDAVNSYLESVSSEVNEHNVLDHLARAFGSAKEAIDTAAAAGEGSPTMGVVATVAKAFIDSNGDRKAAFAHVGDTRLYVLDKDNKLIALTKDESRGHSVHNAVYADGDYDLSQTGIIDFSEGTRLVLISDGISGDYGAEIMSDEEIRAQVVADDPRDAAKNLLGARRKTRDDGSVLIVDSDGTSRANFYDQDENKDDTPTIPLPVPVSAAAVANNDPLARLHYDAQEDGSLVGREWVDEFGYLNRVQSVDENGHVAVQRWQRQDGRKMTDASKDRYSRKLRRQMTYGANVDNVFRDITAWNNGEEGAKPGTRAHAYMYQKAEAKAATTPETNEASRRRTERLRGLGASALQGLRTRQAQVRENGWIVRKNREQEQQQNNRTPERTRKMMNHLGALASRSRTSWNNRRRQTQQETEDNDNDNSSTPASV